MQRKIRLFYQRHKNQIIIAFLCLVILISIIILGFVFARNHRKPVPEKTEPTAGTSVKRQIAGGTPGSEIKKELKALTKEKGYTIVVCTDELLTKRTTKETPYVVYPLTETKYPVYITENHTEYLLFGISYGNSLCDTVLMNAGENRYYTIAGQMEKSEYAERNNYEKGTKKTVLAKNMFHAYRKGKSIDIPDDEMFEKAYIYDADEKEIGCFYY